MYGDTCAFTELLCDYFAISTHIESLPVHLKLKWGMLIIPQLKKKKMTQPWRSRGMQEHISAASQLPLTSTVHTIGITGSIPHSPTNFQRPSQYFSFFLSSSFFLLCLRWILFIPSHQRKERCCCKDQRATF